MNRFGFISLEGHIIKLADVSYVGPIGTIEGLEQKPSGDPMAEPQLEKFYIYQVPFSVGGAQEGYADRDRLKVENFRNSLLNSLEVDETKGAFPKAPVGLDKSVSDYKVVGPADEPKPSAEPAVQQPPTQ
jgi:hypothetical protein